jgi:hypothetical protein
MRKCGARIGAVLTKKWSFCHIFAYFRETILLVFEVEQGNLITSPLTPEQTFVIHIDGPKCASVALALELS